MILALICCVGCFFIDICLFALLEAPLMQSTLAIFCWVLFKNNSLPLQLFLLAELTCLNFIYYGNIFFALFFLLPLLVIARSAIPHLYRAPWQPYLLFFVIYMAQWHLYPPIKTLNSYVYIILFTLLNMLSIMIMDRVR